MEIKIDKEGFPMMAEREVEYIKNLITENNLKVCLEFGSGNSTLYFPKHCPGIKSWLSIEHNGHYIKYLQDKVSEKVQLIWVNDDNWYEDSVKCVGKKYDFILVDGERRIECIKVGVELLKKGGYLLLHDSGRKEYIDILREYRLEKIFDGEKSVGHNIYAHRGIAIYKQKE